MKRQAQGGGTRGEPNMSKKTTIEGLWMRALRRKLKMKRY